MKFSLVMVGLLELESEASRDGQRCVPWYRYRFVQRGLSELCEEENRLADINLGHLDKVRLSGFREI